MISIVKLFFIIPIFDSSAIHIRFGKKIIKVRILYLTFHSDNHILFIMKIKNYFIHPKCSSHKYYEALRMHYVDCEPLEKVASNMGLSASYLVKVKREFLANLKAGINPYFIDIKYGPKIRHKTDKIKDTIIELRKKNLSIIDIKSILDAKGSKISLDAIDTLLKNEGFTRLPRRTREEKFKLVVPNSITAPQASSINLEVDEEFITGKFGGLLTFLPLMEDLGIFKAIKKAKFPETTQISSLSYVLSFLSLKLSGNKRLSHDEQWSLERVLGLFAGLNVLPKSASLSSYSYRVSRQTIHNFLSELSKIFDISGDSEFNLDFKTIPHWGDSSILEKNYSTTRGKSVKSILALIVQNVTDDCLTYSDAEISRRNEKDAILEFVDFWKESHGTSPKMLIFDSQFTVFKNLSRLNQDGIKFITLRAKSEKMVKNAMKKDSKEWQEVLVDAGKRKSRRLKAYEEKVRLRDYEGEIRQIVILPPSLEPVFILTNDFTSSIVTIVRKYARRWLVEQKISEQVHFFHLNQLSSSIAVKVDFDLTLSLLSHNLYRKLAMNIPKHEKCTAETLHRHFIGGKALVKIDGKQIKVSMGKRANLPLLFETPWMAKKTKISHLQKTISFEIATTL